MEASFMETIFVGFLFFSGSVALLYSMIHAIIPSQRIENINLSALLFMLSLLMFQISFIANGMAAAYPALLSFHMTLINAIVPAAYFAYYLVIFPPESLPRRRFIFFIPACIAAAGDIYFMLLPSGTRSDVLKGIFGGGPSRPEITGMRVLIGMAAVQSAVCFSILKIKIVSLWSDKAQSVMLAITGVSSVVIMASCGFIFYGYLTGSIMPVLGGISAIGLLFILSYLAGLRYPRLIHLVILQAQNRYGGSGRWRLSGIDVDALVFQLNRMMVEDELFLDENITLKDLADRVELTQHQLSQLLNEKLNTNFNGFINSFRIDRARELLVSEPDAPVLNIAFAVGFNSKSAFYDAFTRFTGKSPVAYRRENQSLRRPPINSPKL
ncbi:MAG: AraC family transcriptional regulator [Spirochaetes bacterium]|nr:AraC family transcriptional regulator [Spirochaetota bacterium]